MVLSLAASWIRPPGTCSRPGRRVNALPLPHVGAPHRQGMSSRMKRPTAASLKKVTADNLARLGAERLAAILVAAADTRPDLKRRLRMELAADQGADHLTAEVDKRLQSLGSSRSKVSWRQRPSFIRDLDVLRRLISERLEELDRAAALDRLWRLMEVARPLALRVRDRDGELAAVFERAAMDVGGLLHACDIASASEALVEAVTRNPGGWAQWLHLVLAQASQELSHAALLRISAKSGPTAAWIGLIRQMADAAGDPEAYRATYTEAALRSPGVSAEVARRFLDGGNLAEARAVLEAAAPVTTGKRKGAAARELDFDWETIWIEVLERSGDVKAAQAARWASFERTLSADRVRDFTRRLSDFEDVEAEDRAFAFARAHHDAPRGLAFLMDWPALGEAARMVEARADDLRGSSDQAELWAGQLRLRHPRAAQQLLRSAAAGAFRRGAFATADRLTREAEGI